jgi:hypothetical protein
MKQTVTLLSLAVGLTLFSCNSAQNDAGKQAQEIQAAVKKATPGSIPTSADGYSMKAKINGKDWIAEDMIIYEKAGRIIGENNGESISLPYERRYLTPGEKIKFKNHAADIFMNDEVGIWGGTDGELEIVKMDKGSAEGKFFITATANETDKTLKITEGTFRILLPDK